MSKYNQLAMSDMPIFFIAAPTTTDRSTTSTVTISTNNFSASGQPIIYGNSSSFLLSSTTQMILSSDPVFSVGRMTEFVTYATSPLTETAVFVTDIDSGIFLTSNSVLARVLVQNNGLILNNIVEVPIDDWNDKLHVTLDIGLNQINLTVNGISSNVFFEGSILTGTTTTIGANFPTGYKFLIDGIGIYNNKSRDKETSIDDPGTGHDIYSALLYEGQTSKFETYVSGGKKIATVKDFYIQGNSNGGRSYIYRYTIPVGETSDKYLVVKTNKSQAIINYDVDATGINTFMYETIVVLSSNSTVTFQIPIDVDPSFELSVEIIVDPDINSHTPASMISTGTPIFPDMIDESLVNCPVGVDLSNATYTGTWVGKDVVTPLPPNSIELLFKPLDSTQIVVIFKSSDGTITTASQSGYTLWLNGVNVSDLTTLKWNQWNHLILVKSSVSGTTFTLNTDGTSLPMSIKYAFISCYYTSLVTVSIQQLYSVVSGMDIISVNESTKHFSEGVFDTGNAFAVYSLTWSIVGAGGS